MSSDTDRIERIKNRFNTDMDVGYLLNTLAAALAREANLAKKVEQYEQQFVITAEGLVVSLEAEKVLSDIRAENTRLSAEWQQVHDWNNKLVKEHYDLGREIADLRGQVEAAQLEIKAQSDLATGYYGEAQKGWTKFREAELRGQAEAAERMTSQVAAARTEWERKYNGAESSKESWKQAAEEYKQQLAAKSGLAENYRLQLQASNEQLAREAELSAECRRLTDLMNGGYESLFGMSCDDARAMLQENIDLRGQVWFMEAYESHEGRQEGITWKQHAENALADLRDAEQRLTRAEAKVADLQRCFEAGIHLFEYRATIKRADQAEANLAAVREVLSKFHLCNEDEGIPCVVCVTLAQPHSGIALLARVAKAQELIAEIAHSTPEWEDKRIDYDSIQRDKTWLADAKDWLAADPQPKEGA